MEDRLRLNEKLRILRAREDSGAFVELIGRQEGDRPIRMGEVHREWQRLLDVHSRMVIFVRHVNHHLAWLPIAVLDGKRKFFSESCVSVNFASLFFAELF